MEQGKLLKTVNWNGTIFEVGKSYWMDPMVYANLLRKHLLEPVKETPAKVIEEKEVEQPEKPLEAESKPVATSFKPLPNKPAAKPIHKPKGKKR